MNIMISYAHKDQDICLQIHEQLVKDGYQMWLDRDCLRGPTMIGIANAIENSEYVLICASNAYKQSVLLSIGSSLRIWTKTSFDSDYHRVKL